MERGGLQRGTGTGTGSSGGGSSGGGHGLRGLHEGSSSEGELGEEGHRGRRAHDDGGAGARALTRGPEVPLCHLPRRRSALRGTLAGRVAVGGAAPSRLTQREGVAATATSTGRSHQRPLLCWAAEKEVAWSSIGIDVILATSTWLAVAVRETVLPVPVAVLIAGL